MRVNNNRNSNGEDQNQKVVFDSLFAVWSFARPILIILTGVMILFAGIYFTIDYLKTNYWNPVDPNDHTPMEVIIEMNSRAGKIAETLESYGVIRNATVFEYYVEFSGYANDLKAGNYVLNKQMSMKDIMDKLVKGDGKAAVTKFTIIEGSNIDEMVAKLVKDKIIKNKNEFLELCKTGKEFMSYNFIADLDNDKNIARKYLMEGYLFPATYEIYINAKTKTIIQKTLTQFSNVLSDKYLARAEELDMTVDEVITLASIIEKEAKHTDFKKVSAVFHNRLKKDMTLGSCPTVQYALGIKRLSLTAEDIATESPYNTYKYKGLPIGPICSPSQKAIEAALYPDETFIDENYLYFVSKDPESGELEFNKTLEAHNAAKAKYSPLWKAYDEKYGN